MIFKNSKLLLSALVPITAALFALLLITGYTIYGNNNETSMLLILAQESDEAKARTQAIRMAHVEGAKDIEAFENLILSEDGAVSFIETIEEAGEALKVNAKVASVAKVGDESPDGTKMIRVAMETESSWPGVFSFLKAVESLPYKVAVEEVNVFKENSRWRSKIILLLNSFD